MSYCVHGGLVPTFANRYSLSWRAFFNGITELARACRRRQEQRQELLDYMANDHRAAADIGITSYEARNWSQRPFWRP